MFGYMVRNHRYKNLPKSRAIAKKINRFPPYCVRKYSLGVVEYAPPR